MQAPSSFAERHISVSGEPLLFFQRRKGIWAGRATVPREQGRVGTGPLAGNLLAAHLSQLARAPGAGFIIQGEHLAIRHLPSLIVAVSAHGTALPVRVERVGTGDGAVHGGTGH